MPVPTGSNRGRHAIDTALQKQQVRAAKLTDFVRAEALSLGFDLCRITAPDSIPQAPERLQEFIDNGFHGTMGWMEETQARRANPKTLWSDVRSVVMFGLNYGPLKTRAAFWSSGTRVPFPFMRATAIIMTSSRDV